MVRFAPNSVYLFAIQLHRCRKLGSFNCLENKTKYLYQKEKVPIRTAFLRLDFVINKKLGPMNLHPKGLLQLRILCDTDYYEK